MKYRIYLKNYTPNDFQLCSLRCTELVEVFSAINTILTVVRYEKSTQKTSKK